MLRRAVAIVGVMLGVLALLILVVFLNTRPTPMYEVEVVRWSSPSVGEPAGEGQAPFAAATEQTPLTSQTSARSGPVPFVLIGVGAVVLIIAVIGFAAWIRRR